MTLLQGICLFPGVQQVLSAQFALSTGVTPSCAQLEIVPQAGFVGKGGTLEFRFGSTRLSFPFCAVDSFQTRLDSSGKVISLSIMDRRWRWQFGAISGSYNPMDMPYGVSSIRRKNAQELAALCLRAMGESVFDIREVPTTAFPEVEWDHTNPARALADLADKVGCRVVLHLNNLVGVHRTGVGRDLPVANLMSGGVGIDPPELPDSVLLVGSRVRYQVEFSLRAVGLDTDGKVKPINSLSYAPLLYKWRRQNPWDFPGLPDGAPAVGQAARPGTARDLALRTVYRWYSIYLPTTGLRPPTIPDAFGVRHRIRDIDQFLPLESEQVSTVVEDNKTRNKPAQIFGRHHDGGPTFTTRGRTEQVKFKFRILADRGIVEFSRPVFRYDTPTAVVGEPVDPASREYYEADIRLRTACPFRQYPDYGVTRFQHLLVNPGPKFGTGPATIFRDDLNYTLKADYDNEGTFIRWVDNTIQIQDQVNYYLSTSLAQFQAKSPVEASYAGLVPIDLDGAIQQVSWSVGPQGAITRASRNCEMITGLPTFRERRFYEQMIEATRRDQFAEIRRLRDEQRRRAGRPAGS